MMMFRSFVEALGYICKCINDIYEKKFNGIGHIVHNCTFNNYTFLDYEDAVKNKLLYKLLLESKFAKDEKLFERGNRLSPPVDYVLVQTRTYEVLLYRWENDEFVNKKIAKYVIVQIRFFRGAEGYFTYYDDFFFIYLKQLV